MANAYIVRVVSCPDGTNAGWLTHDDDLTSTDKSKARVFSSLLSADSYAAAMDIQYPEWQHTVEVL